MKNVLKIITILFFAWMVISCTKENDPGNGSGNGGNGMGQSDYSYGYYHPAKKIKTIHFYRTDTQLKFIWNGDDLSYIENRNSLNHIYSGSPDAVYHIEYNAEGRISCIWDSIGINNYHKITYQYYFDRIEKQTVSHDGICDNGVFSPILEINYSDGYDQAYNPLKDFDWYRFIETYYVPFNPVELNHDGRFIHNRIKDENVEYRYDYDNDNYPTVCWELTTNYYGNPVEKELYSITYYPMGGDIGVGSYNGHDYVDLGLPSGTLWATCNVGAETPESAGYCFAWGETSPKNTFNWNNYKYCHNGDYNQLTKYCSNMAEGYNGYTDNLTTLQPEDDAASVNWGAGWRTPNEEECLELINYTTSEEITRNNVKGWLVTGPNGNNIFMPSVYNGGSRGRCWSNSLCDGSNSVYSDYFTPLGNNVFSEERCCGFPVRPVCVSH